MVRGRYDELPERSEFYRLRRRKRDAAVRQVHHPRRSGQHASHFSGMARF
jgi:hypothetical protein